MPTMKPEDIALEFTGVDRVAAIRPFHAGHINESFVVTAATDDGPKRYFLQRINSAIFPRPVDVMENIARVTAHLAEKERERSSSQPRRPVLTLNPTRDARTVVCDAVGGCWRMFEFIEGSRSVQIADSPQLVELTGRTFGEFMVSLRDLPPPRLHEVLPGFHDTPSRLRMFEEAVARDIAARRHEVAEEIEFIVRHAGLAERLVALRRRGAVPERVVHNDAKLSNVLLDDRTGAALCVVDLDIVMPGLSLFDFGDMVRSMSSTAAEDEPDSGRVRLRVDLFEALARGYLSATRAMLTSAEIAHLVDSGIVITYEQALRFLGDYLNGDQYYRVTRARQNLDRARTQIRLVEELLRHEPELRRVVGG
jgi:Ser/Thr protein kinase RdoA (MazF antagonist)